MDKYQILAILAGVLLILLIIVLNSRNRILKTYDKYMKVSNKANITGKEIAFIAKQQLELSNLSFALTKYKLGDAYSPKHKTLIMSEEVCNTASLASLTIVSHELGHAVQDKNHTPLFVFNQILTKLTRLTNKLIMPALIIGGLLYVLKVPNENVGLYLMITSGVLFALHAMTQLLNVPVEYDASKRALKFLKQNNYVSSSEYKKAKKLLSIAAQTYIANLFDGIFILNTKKRKK